jgi:quercetin dioxygenase-like cupin family protein
MKIFGFGEGKPKQQEKDKAPEVTQEGRLVAAPDGTVHRVRNTTEQGKLAEDYREAA